ncbi:MAG TPA: hypothetical protein VM283_02330, partial [Armatimonadota bacterium]|nr:hypothetical protein [Armatimonadota bacterium]
MLLSFVLRIVRRHLCRASLAALTVAMVAAGSALCASVSQALVAATEDALGDGRAAQYDILVRPVGSRTELEATEGLVEPNHLSGITGGITFDAYEAIRNVPGVEIAAPIAILGYQRLDFRVGTLLTVDGTYAIRCVREERDGAWTYRDESVVAYTLTAQGSAGADQNAEMTSVPERVPTAGCVFEFWALVAAVDPRAEDALVGLKSAVHGTYLRAEWGEICAEHRSAAGTRTDCRIPVLLYLPNRSTVSLYAEIARPGQLADEADWREARTVGATGSGDLLDRLYSREVSARSSAWLPIAPVRYRRVEPPANGPWGTVLEAGAARPWPSFPWGAPLAVDTPISLQRAGGSTDRRV